jgi:hypothetical protein
VSNKGLIRPRGFNPIYWTMVSTNTLASALTAGARRSVSRRPRPNRCSKAEGRFGKPRFVYVVDVSDNITSRQGRLSDRSSLRECGEQKLRIPTRRREADGASRLYLTEVGYSAITMVAQTTCAN